MYICDVGDGNHDGQRKDSIRGQGEQDGCRFRVYISFSYNFQKSSLKFVGFTNFGQMEKKYFFFILHLIKKSNGDRKIIKCDAF